MAVCAEMQRVAVLLSVRITAAQLEVHLLPLQVTLVAHHQTLSDLRRGTKRELKYYFKEDFFSTLILYFNKVFVTNKLKTAEKLCC